VKDSDGVAVGDADNTPSKLLGFAGWAKEEEDYG
jgi:hypothetical protein